MFWCYIIWSLNFILPSNSKNRDPCKFHSKFYYNQLIHIRIVDLLFHFWILIFKSVEFFILYDLISTNALLFMCDFVRIFKCNFVCYRMLYVGIVDACKVYNWRKLYLCTQNWIDFWYHYFIHYSDICLFFSIFPYKDITFVLICSFLR